MAKVVTYETAGVEVWMDTELEGAAGAAYYVSEKEGDRLVARFYPQSVEDIEATGAKANAQADSAQAALDAPEEEEPDWDAIKAAMSNND